MMQGVDYGWLKKKHPELELKPMMSAYGGDGGGNMFLLVGKWDTNKPLTDFKGTKLARYNRQGMEMLDASSLEYMLREEGLAPRGFFQTVDSRYPTPLAAVEALSRGDTDCLLIEVATWGPTSESAWPAHCQAESLFSATAPTLPPKVLVGRPKNLASTVRLIYGGICKHSSKRLIRNGRGQAVRAWFMRIKGFKRRDRRISKIWSVDTGRDLLEWSDRLYAKPK